MLIYQAKKINVDKKIQNKNLHISNMVQVAILNK